MLKHFLRWGILLSNSCRYSYYWRQQQQQKTHTGTTLPLRVLQSTHQSEPIWNIRCICRTSTRHMDEIWRGLVVVVAKSPGKSVWRVLSTIKIYSCPSFVLCLLSTLYKVSEFFGARFRSSCGFVFVIWYGYGFAWTFTIHRSWCTFSLFTEWLCMSCNFLHFQK